jgi:hypothetical protein
MKICKLLNHTSFENRIGYSPTAIHMNEASVNLSEVKRVYMNSQYLCAL